MQNHIFLDLEDTVIEPLLFGSSSWFNCEFLIHNIEVIKKFISTHRDPKVHLFSFAVHNIHELSAFNQGTRPHLEKLLGVKFEMTPTVDDDIIPACCRQKSMAASLVTFTEAVEFWGKHDAFRMYIRDFFSKHNHNEKISVTLFDDCVFDETFHWPDMNLSGSIIRV